MRMAITFLVSLTTLLCGAGQAHDFTWDNLLLAKMKLDEGFDYETHVDSYMQVYRPNVWKRYKNDEFELEDRRRETITLMRARIQRFRVDESFVLYTTLKIGEYDFARSLFPVTEATDGTYWYKTTYPYGDFPSRFNVSFKNPEVFGEIPMPKSAARSFLGRRRNRYGNITRTVGAAITFSIVELKGSNDLLAEIESVRFYEDSNRTRLMHVVTRQEENAAELRN